MDAPTIKKISHEDVGQLQMIARQTFQETFAAGNTEENMRQYLEHDLSLERLTAELRNELSAFYFAFQNDAVIGYLKLNFGWAQTELQDPEALEIERIYVVQEHQGNKAGQLLFQTALELANEKHLKYIWLGVWEENRRAIHFYKKNGLVEFDSHVFLLGDDEQRDVLMKLELKKTA